jgi:hypothetical protein
MNSPLYDCALSLATVFSGERRQNHSSQALAKDPDLTVGWMVKAKNAPMNTREHERKLKADELRYTFLQQR